MVGFRTRGMVMIGPWETMQTMLNMNRINHDPYFHELSASLEIGILTSRCHPTRKNVLLDFLWISISAVFTMSSPFPLPCTLPPACTFSGS